MASQTAPQVVADEPAAPDDKSSFSGVTLAKLVLDFMSQIIAS